MPEGARQQLLEGTWDTTGELLAARDAIEARPRACPTSRLGGDGLTAPATPGGRRAAGTA